MPTVLPLWLRRPFRSLQLFFNSSCFHLLFLHTSANESELSFCLPLSLVSCCSLALSHLYSINLSSVIWHFIKRWGILGSGQRSTQGHIFSFCGRFGKAIELEVYVLRRCGNGHTWRKPTQRVENMPTPVGRPHTVQKANPPRSSVMFFESPLLHLFASERLLNCFRPPSCASSLLRGPRSMGMQRLSTSRLTTSRPHARINLSPLFLPVEQD